MHKRRARSAVVRGQIRRRGETAYTDPAAREVFRFVRSCGNPAFLQVAEIRHGPMMGDLRIVHVGNLADSAGTETVAALSGSFACPRNAEVETFLKRNALDFTRRSVSVTHLVVSTESRECLGYFTLTHKPFSVKAQSLSNAQRKRMERFSKYDSALGVYTVSAFLIAQIGKNFSASAPLSGSQLLVAAFDRITAAIHEVGGQVVFLECEDGNVKLRAFYERNGFSACSRRYSETDGVFYLQMFRFLK